MGIGLQGEGRKGRAGGEQGGGRGDGLEFVEPSALGNKVGRGGGVMDKLGWAEAAPPRPAGQWQGDGGDAAAPCSASSPLGSWMGSSY